MKRDDSFRFVGERPISFSTLNSGLRDETNAVSADFHSRVRAFSTLNSGLRDETERSSGSQSAGYLFQYPQLGPTR